MNFALKTISGKFGKTDFYFSDDNDFTKQVNLHEVIAIKHFGSFQKLKPVIASVFRFFDNLKQNILTHFRPMLHLRINQVVDFY